MKQLTIILFALVTILTSCGGPIGESESTAIETDKYLVLTTENIQGAWGSYNFATFGQVFTRYDSPLEIQFTVIDDVINRNSADIKIDIPWKDVLNNPVGKVYPIRLNSKDKSVNYSGTTTITASLLRNDSLLLEGNIGNDEGYYKIGVELNDYTLKK